jgi:hypothetical protein
MVLDIPNKKEEEEDLEDEVKAASTDQTVDRMKGSDQLV